MPARPCTRRWAPGCRAGERSHARLGTALESASRPGRPSPHNLPTAPPKSSDRRSFSGTSTTQAEALPPDVLAAIVREAIEARRDPAVHQRALEREEIERQAVRERLGPG